MDEIDSRTFRSQGILGARRPSVRYEGLIYHVMNCGDWREPIVRSEADRALWIGTLGDACQKRGWRAHAYCLMVALGYEDLQGPCALERESALGGVRRQA
jgi:hypothetical protein